jgi:hypothetical protein
LHREGHDLGLPKPSLPKRKSLETKTVLLPKPTPAKPPAPPAKPRYAPEPATSDILPATDPTAQDFP